MGGEEFWAAIGTPMTGLIVAVLIWAKVKLERSLKRTTQVVENGIQGRLDKIEAGVFGTRTEIDNLSQRLVSVEEKLLGGSGQHFVPPLTASAEPVVDSGHTVPGTRQEKT